MSTMDGDKPGIAEIASQLGAPVVAFKMAAKN
jgi:hypothetical protein